MTDSALIKDLDDIQRKRSFCENDLCLLYVVFLAALILLTNLSSLASVLVYSAACLLYILFTDFKRGIYVVFLNLIYLGYSYIEFPSGLFFGASELVTLCVVLLVARWSVVRLFINTKTRKTIRINFFTVFAIIVALYFSMSRIRSSYFSIVSMFTSIVCAVIFSNEIEDRKYSGETAIALFCILLTVVFYYFIWARNVSSVHDYWVGNRFIGVRDPNNFALFANYSIVLFCMSKEKISSWLRFFCIVILSICILATISLSGILSLLIVYVFILISKKKIKSLAILFGLAISAFLFYRLIGSMTFSESTTIGAVMIRFQNLFKSLSEGDYYSATTTRYGIWENYMRIYNSLPENEKMFGNISLIDKRLLNGEMAPHNTFIDVLITYGMAGLVLFSSLIVVNLIKNLRRRKYWNVALALIFVVNLFFRTILSAFLWIGILS